MSQSKPFELPDEELELLDEELPEDESDEEPKLPGSL
jgi:hypothetical protein